MSKCFTSECPPYLAGCFQIEDIQVGSTLTAALDIDEPLPLQLLEVRVRALPRYAHFLGKPVLPRKAIVLIPDVLQQHCICELCTGGYPVAHQHVIGYFRVPLCREHVGSFEDEYCGRAFPRCRSVFPRDVPYPEF